MESSTRPRSCGWLCRVPPRWLHSLSPRKRWSPSGRRRRRWRQCRAARGWAEWAIWISKHDQQSKRHAATCDRADRDADEARATLDAGGAGEGSCRPVGGKSSAEGRAMEGLVRSSHRHSGLWRVDAGDLPGISGALVRDQVTPRRASYEKLVWVGTPGTVETTEAFMAKRQRSLPVKIAAGG